MNTLGLEPDRDANWAGTVDTAKNPSKFGRKAMLVGMATSMGFVVANAAGAPSASAAGELYPSATERGVNARKNGCAANGVTDDTAALLAVRNLAASLGVPVFLPKGVYLVSSLLLNVADQCWELADGAVIKQKAATTTVGIVTITAPGVTFRGGRIDGNMAAQTYLWGAGITVQSSNVTIDSVEITNVLAGGIILKSTAVGCLVKNNYCHNNGRSTNAANGILLDGATRARVIGNRCENNGTAGNEALYDGNGIYLTGTGVGHNMVANNQCSFNARRGIKVQQSGNNIVGNTCVLNSCGIGVTVSINPTNSPTVVSGNLIKDSTLQGLQLDRCSFLTITGNSIIDSGSHGVGASSSTNYVTFTGNTVLRAGSNAMNLAASLTGWVISGNTFLDNGNGLVLTTCSRMIITGNLVGNSPAGGTHVNGFKATTCDRVSVTGNMVGAGVTTGYSLGGTNITQSGNV
jgi:parallel beta-helix repeat protein